MQLIIVESPTKARTLTKFLGKDYVVEATMGHIKDLPKSKLGIDIENNFKPDYVEMPKKLDTIKTLQKDAKKAKSIFIATDPDREGEAIASHVEQILRYEDTKSASPISRITFHEITKEAVEEAIAHPSVIDKNLVDAQIGRRVLDRLVGYELSPLLWRKIRRGLSAGRVQSVAVRLIVEKEKEIEKFKAEEYWQVSVDLSTKTSKKFSVLLIKPDIHNKTDADKIVTDLKSSAFNVSDVRKRQVTKNPFPPFTTSTMTQSAARVFGWSAKRTMSVAQKLYEEGLITYHRTDSTNIAAVAINKVRDFITNEFGASYLPSTPRAYKIKSKVAQEAHEAIRPTEINQLTNKPINQLTADESKLLDLIWRRFVACQMNPSIYDETTINVTARCHSDRSESGVEESLYLLRASGQIMQFDGWRKLIVPRSLGEEGIIPLPDLQKGEDLKLLKINPLQKFTLPPARFNEASLIKMLEKLGIGRPSTYAPIITTIQIRQYVEKKDRQFFATPVGIAVTEFLMKNFPEVLDYKFTAEMEDDLDKVANGDKDWQKEIKTFYGPFHKKLVDVTKNSERVAIPTEKLGRKCPDCKEGELVIRTGRFGKFISCSRFPECKHTEKYLVKIDMKCPECKEGEVIVKKTGKGRPFFGCSRYPDCKWASWKNPKLVKETK